MQRSPEIDSRFDTARRGQRRVLQIPLSIALASLAGIMPPAANGQTVPATPTPAANPSPDAIKQREQELEDARARQKSSAEAQEKLKADIAAIGQDRSKLNQQLIDIAAQVRGVETKIGDTEARLRPLDSREQEIRGSLDSRRSEIVEVLAALQRAGRRSPPALLVRPEDALASLRTAMLLGSVVPELRARAQKLAGDLGELVALRKTITTERDALASDRDKLNNDQTRLAALIDERQRQQNSIEKDMATESARAIALSKQVDSLQGLIAKMEQDSKAAARAAATANLQGTPTGKPNLAALKDPSRLSPAVAFASAKGLFALPVNGTRIRDFGGSDGAGGVEKGISLATRPRH
jgi:septal ring factor EnvC (AmiA/AmiB activator)